jgi:6-phosphogluconolactonase
LSETVVGSHASFLHLDQSERFLISSYYFEGHVMIHAVADGFLRETALQTIETADRPHSVEIDQSNRFVFVPHTAANGIFQFEFDSSEGTIASNEVAVLKREGVAGPRHFRLATNGLFGYGSDEQGNSVTVYRLDSENGRLETLQTLSTLPNDFEGKNSTSDVGIHPSGRFVYVANRGHDSLAAFLVDSEPGELSPVDRFACEAATRSFEFSPDGRFLYAAGSGSGKFAAYRVNEDNGALVRFQTLEIGEGPWAMAKVETQ